MRATQIDPARLRLARQMRGVTQATLAHEVQVTAAALSQYENGAASPSPEKLERLALALKVAPHFLQRPVIGDSEREPFFRAMTRTPASERARAHAYALLLGEVAELLDHHVELPDVQIRQLADLNERSSMDEVEAIALRARAAWSVPPGPVADVIRLAEARGVIVAAVGAFDERVDAFSLRVGHRPVIVLCTGKGVTARRRFDCAHELGHLALHSGRLLDARRMESQAHRFASALLMPAGEVEPDLPRRPGDLSQLEEGSKRWGVSMQALLHRAKDLGALSVDGFTRSMKRMSSAGWRTREPVEVGPPERPELLRAAVAALPDAGSSLAAVADEFGMPQGRLARMLSVPEDVDDSGGAQVVDIGVGSH